MFLPGQRVFNAVLLSMTAPPVAFRQKTNSRRPLVVKSNGANEFCEWGSPTSLINWERSAKLRRQQISPWANDPS